LSLNFKASIARRCDAARRKLLLLLRSGQRHWSPHRTAPARTVDLSRKYRLHNPDQLYNWLRYACKH
jgi:hypothetical protein